MALRQQDQGGDSSTLVSFSPPNDDEKEIREVENDAEKSIPSDEHGIKSSNSVQAPVVLDWDGPDDPANPQRWSPSKKLYHILVPTILGFVV